MANLFKENFDKKWYMTQFMKSMVIIQELLFKNYLGFCSNSGKKKALFRFSEFLIQIQHFAKI